jgi:hypothetical protein
MPWPMKQSESEGGEAMMWEEGYAGWLWGYGCEKCVGWLCVQQAPTIPVELRGSHAQVRQKIGNQRHIDNCQKALDETSQTITFN